MRLLTEIGGATCRSEHPALSLQGGPAAKHGPCLQLSYSRGGRSRTENVRPEHLPPSKAQIANYRKLRDLIDERSKLRARPLT